MSNPCNPTGKAILGDELAAWVGTARRLDCTLLLDEFYSHYVWHGADPLMSAAACVEDVERDPVVIFDGLTKNWRYPGWRMSWTLGPSRVIEAIASAGSFLDGGGSRPLQRAALDVLSAEHARAEAEAIRRAFGAKRTLLVNGLRALGVRLEREPDGTFYVWGNLEKLPPPLDTGEGLFRAALAEKVIVVPGAFFDVRPGAAPRGTLLAFSTSRSFQFRTQRKRRHDRARQATRPRRPHALKAPAGRSFVRPIRGDIGNLLRQSRLTSRETSRGACP